MNHSPVDGKPPALAVIGCGWWGPKLVRVFNQVSSGCIKAVADLSEERLALIRQHYPQIRTTTNYRELLADPEIHGVCVATPMETHYAIAREALLSGKHLLLEKPMTTDADQAGELLQISEDRGLTLLVDHIFLYTSAIKHLEALIRSGQMGQLHYAESTRINLAPPQATHNVVWDLAPHDVSICLYLFDEMPDKVICHAKRYRHPSLEDVASIHLFFPSGKWAHIHVSWLCSRKTREMRVFCSEKSAFYDDTAEDKIRIFGKGMDTRLTTGAAAPLLHSYGPDSTETPVLDSTEPLRNEASDFLESLITGRKQTSSGRIGHSVICTLEAAAESMKQMGKMVEVRT